MNERIFDLAVKHKHIVGELPLNVVEELKLVELERFAEAIIQECIDCAVCEELNIECLYCGHDGVDKDLWYIEDEQKRMLAILRWA